MQKIIAMLLAISLLCAFTGCVSQSDLDAVVAERDVLQEERDTLQAKIEQYSEIINAMDAEEYETAIEIISEKIIAKEVAAKGDIEDYLVTVELTLDNFDEYFEWEPIYSIDDFGEPVENMLHFSLLSKVSDGLILYESDVKLGFTTTGTYTYSGGTHPSSFDNTDDLQNLLAGGSAIGGSPGSVWILEKCHVDTTRVEGTVTFVNAEYVSNYELGEVQDAYIQNAEIMLTNGEKISRIIWYGNKY